MLLTSFDIFLCTFFTVFCPSVQCHHLNNRLCSQPLNCYWLIAALLVAEAKLAFVVVSPGIDLPRRCFQTYSNCIEHHLMYDLVSDGLFDQKQTKSIKSVMA